MVHVAAKFRENTSMRFRVTVQKLNVTDRQTDGGRCTISHPRAYGAAGDNMEAMWILLSHCETIKCTGIQLKIGISYPKYEINPYTLQN